MDLVQTRKILETALRQGGKVLMEHFGKVGKVRVKESISSVVTEADLASEKVIIEILDRAPFQYNIISEEAGFLDRSSICTWVVDPLDGTSNFAAGLPWFGVIIAFFKENEPVQGGMYLPFENQLYFGERGKGSWRNDRPVHAVKGAELESMLVSYSFDFSDDPGKTKSEMEIMTRLSKSVRNIRSTNSLVDFCFTADGRLGAAINQTTKIWDIAAPGLIIREAGGMISDIQGKEIVYDLSPGTFDSNYTILASGGDIHSELLSVILA